MDFKRLEFSDRYRQQYEDWLKRADILHHDFVSRANEDLAWTPVTKEPRDARVALVTTAGVHRTSEEPFDDVSLEGDPTFRVIPSDVASDELMVTHNHYDHSDADKDINCLFPIDRLREMAAEGLFGELAPEFFGFMGFNPQ